MKFICLGYLDEKKWESMSESERNAFFDVCFSYDDVLRANGHYAGGEGLQNSRTAATVRIQNGKLSVTDGPFVETKEQLGGILILEARDMAEAIELISKHPGVSAAGFEIRPAANMAAVLKESEQRRRLPARRRAGRK
jgi:hypothetical protein